MISIQTHKPKKHSGGYLTAVLVKSSKVTTKQNYFCYVNGTNFLYKIPDPVQQISLAKNVPNLLTNGGRDQMHDQVYIESNAANTERGAGFIAVSTGTTNETASSTTLETEIASGGLARADATTKTHTSGTNSSTIEHTFTASATHTAVHKSATFNAASSGIMHHVANFTSDATLVSGDTLKVTWTLNLG